MNCKICGEPILALSPRLKETLCIKCETREIQAALDFIDLITPQPVDNESYPNTIDDDIADWGTIRSS